MINELNKYFRSAALFFSLFLVTRIMVYGQETPDEKAGELLSKMSLDEKIGQMTLIEQAYLKSPNDIKNYLLGGLLSGGEHTRLEKYLSSDWAAMIDSFQKIALQTRLKIPVFYGIDAVHGNGGVRNSVIFPHNIGMGCTRDPVLVEQMARATALETYACGVNWVFAPCLAVSRNIRWGRAYESYSENPDVVSVMGEEEVRGLQSSLRGGRFSISAAAKHYAGDGGTGDSLWQNMWGIDRGNTVMPENKFRAVHLKPYFSAVDAGARSVMVSFSSWNGIKMSANRYLITGVLKGEMHFGGFVVSDWGALNQLSGDYMSQIETAVNAGIDMIMVPDNYHDFEYNLKELVGEWKIPMSRIDDAVRRILRVKYEMGLFSYPFSDPSLIKEAGAEEHRRLARRCVRESAVLLKNKAFLPLNKKIKRIFVCGKNSDNLGYQCGGWSIKWQGFDGNDATKGTTVLQAIRETVSPGTEIIYSMNGSGLDNSGADAAVVVLGEKPYAEFMGDRFDLSLDESDYEVIETIKKSKVPKLLVIISGRPVMISDIIDDFDAVIAAWLPGSEGEGWADIIFGDYKPTGRLSFSWPKNMAQVTMDKNRKDYNPLFPFGFGLGY